MAKDKPRLKEIKSGMLSRGFALAKMGVTMGAKAAGHSLSVAWNSENRGDLVKTLLTEQAVILARELGTLKGSVMKVGQMVSVLGEHLFPPEVNAVLKSLQNQSPPVEWESMERQLKRSLGAEAIANLEIDPEPFAAASIGQVHLAKIKKTGQKLALKIQYPGVDRSIASDVKALKSMLQVASLLPKGPDWEEIFEEVKQMLTHEVDYVRERKTTDLFSQILAGDDRFVIPKTFEEFSSPRVLATSFEEGVSVDDPRVMALSQERRNALGMAALEYYFKELFVWRKMQTDPHFGNYRVRLAPQGLEKAKDQWIMLDFGAVREVPKRFARPYFDLIRAAALGDSAGIIQAGKGLGLLADGDPQALIDHFASLCLMITEPYRLDQEYDFGKSDLSKRSLQSVFNMVMNFKVSGGIIRTPPRELVFLDRKLGGIFILLSTLGVKANVRPLLLEYLERGCLELERSSVP